MRRLLSLGFVALMALVLVACSKAAEKSPIGLKMETITIDTDQGTRTFQVEIADNDAERERGLMFRKAMEADHGMLFVFERDEGVAFWMKNTILPLDLIFIRSDGSISSVAANATPQSTQEIPSAEMIRGVLEINAGKAMELDIIPGDVVHAKAFHNAKQ
ncbi:MAG TPA: DUF192 domain-containing protein [Rhizomicrobium sp.]|jgi:hypothetical protein